MKNKSKLFLVLLVAIIGFANLKADGGAGVDSGQSCVSSEPCDIGADGLHRASLYGVCGNSYTCCAQASVFTRGCKAG